MSININIGGIQKNLSTAKVNIGGAWKQVTKASVNIGGVWKTVWTSQFYNVTKNWDISSGGSVGPSGVALDSTGNVYTFHRDGSNTVKVFNPSGSLIRTLTLAGTGGSPPAIDSSDRIVCVSSNVLYRYNCVTGALIDFISLNGDGLYDTYELKYINNYYYILCEEKTTPWRVAFIKVNPITMVASLRIVCGNRYWGIEGGSRLCWDVDINENYHYAISTASGLSIWKFNSSGVQQYSTAVNGTDEGATAYALAVDKFGSVYFAYNSITPVKHQLRKLIPGSGIATVATGASTTYYGIFIDSDANIYSALAGMVYKYDANLASIWSIGVSSTSPGYFDMKTPDVMAVFGADRIISKLTQS